MKNKIRILDIVLSIIICLISFIAFQAESFRILVFILGVFYIIAFMTQLVLGFLQVVRGNVPIGLFFSLVLLVFTQNESINSTYVMVVEKPSAGVVLLIVLITTIALTFFLFGVAEGPKKIKSFLLFFPVSCLISCGIVLYGILPITNYAFDTSETVEIDVTVKSCSGDAFAQVGTSDEHYAYEIDSPSGYTIDQITIDTDYGVFEKGNVIRIKYRQGLFAPIYRVDYLQFEEVSN